MQVSDVMADVYNDIRQLLNTTTDASIYIPWVNRIQKDCLHTSLYNYLIQGVQGFTTSQDVSNYTLGTLVRRIILVYDRAFDRIIQDLDDITAPKQDATSPVAGVDGAMLSAQTMSQWPLYYRRTGAQTLTLFPAPQKAAFGGAYEIHYEEYTPDLALTTDVLLIPNDGKDLVVAGVNSYACSYLKLYDEATKWQQIYEQMKNGIAVK